MHEEFTTITPMEVDISLATHPDYEKFKVPLNFLNYYFYYDRGLLQCN